MRLILLAAIGAMGVLGPTSASFAEYAPLNLHVGFEAVPFEPLACWPFYRRQQRTARSGSTSDAPDDNQTAVLAACLLFGLIERGVQFPAFLFCELN
jgi:hypothetical protein